MQSAMTPTEKQKRLSQFLTPGWAASALVEQFFPRLSASDLVLEPSCGAGAFLSAIDATIPAVGVEIDPELAVIARQNTGRRIIVGDFRLVDLPFQPTHIVGNPPFVSDLVMDFLERAYTLLPEEGEVGFVLPCYMLQTASTVETLAERWSMSQALIPKNLYPRLQYPLCFAHLTKGRTKGMVGFALYHELAAINRLQKRYRELLAAGQGSVWAAVVQAALEQLGGRAALTDIYREIEGHQPTKNTYWKEKVRQTLQRIAVRVGEGLWELPESMPCAA